MAQPPQVRITPVPALQTMLLNISPASAVGAAEPLLKKDEAKLQMVLWTGWVNRHLEEKVAQKLQIKYGG